MQEAFVRMWERALGSRRHARRTCRLPVQDGVEPAPLGAPAGRGRDQAVGPAAGRARPVREGDRPRRGRPLAGGAHPRQRAAVVVTELLGYSSEEAGTILGIRPGTVRTLTAQARAALQEWKERGMSDLKALLEHAERAVSVVPLPTDGLDGLQRRRDRKRRNQRLSAGFVGIAVFVSAVGIVTTGMPFDRTETPAVPSAAGSGAALDPFISINAQLSGDQPVDLFKVKTSDPQYWRLYTLDVYDGEEWRSSDPDGSVGGQSVSVPTVLPQAPAYTFPRTPRPSRSRSRSSATSTRRTRCRWRSRRRRSPPEASAT